jgi:CheY-like chemotaxis protein
VNLTFADENVVIEAVGTGDLALERARLARPDIILADIFMPGKNGYEVCEAIKTDPELGDIPVVLLVGTFEPFDEAEAARVRCDSYLTKPFDTTELVETVHALVERRRNAAREAAAAETSTLAASSRAAEAAGPPEATASVEATADAPAEGGVSSRTRESFLGAGRILDLFEPPLPSRPGAGETRAAATAEAATLGDPAPAGIPSPALREPPSARSQIRLSDEVVDAIVERVVRRLSTDVVREVAWDVVPEMAESLIRQYLDEHPPGRSR